MLEGVRILDLTRLLPGAYCSMLMADLGAEVLKVEEPGKGDYFRWVEPLNGNQSIYFQAVNRNKLSMTLDLKKERGRNILIELLKSYDVLLESFRPGVMGRLGLDYETVKKGNPSIVYCSISSYGQGGPYKNRVGHDGNYIALGGLLNIGGASGGPPIHPPVPLADLAVGGFMAAFSVVSALFQKQRTGKGQYLDISMLDGVVSLLTVFAAEYFFDQREVKRGENHFAGCSVANTVYETKDGRFMCLSIIEEKFWQNFCEAISRPDLIGENFFEIKSKSLLYTEIQKTMLTRTKDEWVTKFDGLEVCCEPVNTLSEAFDNEQVRFRDMIIEVEHPLLGKIKQVGNPIKAPGGTRINHEFPPEMGQATHQILKKLGLAEMEIDQLKKEKVI